MGIYGDLLELNQEQKPVPQSEEPAVSSPTSDALAQAKARTKKRPVKRATGMPSNRDTTPPRHHATTVAGYHATLVESIRAAVKLFGKEAATHRFTAEE